MKTAVIVLGASRYSFPNSETGEIIEGTKVHYIEQDAQSDEHVVGHSPQSANLPYEYFDKLKAIPGVYDAEISIKLSGKKPSIKISGFEFKTALSFAK